MKRKLLTPCLTIIGLFLSLLSGAQSIDNINPDICSVKNYLPVNNPHLSNIDVITQDKNGSMIFAYKVFGRNVSCFDGNKWEYIDESNYLPSNYISAVFTDSKKNLWIGTNKGLSMFDGTTWKKFLLTEYEVRNVTSFAEDTSGRIWIFGYNLSLTFDGTQLKDMKLNLNEWINNAVFDKNNNLWFNGTNNVIRYDGTKFTRYSVNDGLNSMYISNICLVDSVIYCLYYGVDSVSRFENNKWVNSAPPVKDGIGYKLIMKDKSKRTWMLDNWGGVFRHDQNGWTKCLNFNIYAIATIYEDKDGYLWFGGKGGQVVKYDSDGPEIFTKSNNDGISFVDVADIFADKQNRIWVRSNEWFSGISCFDGKKWTNYNNFNPGNSRFFLDNNDTLYVGGPGIHKFTGKEWQSLNYSMGLSYSQYNKLIIDKKNRFWFSPGPGKIVVTDGKNTTEFSESDGLLAGDVGSIILDRDSNVWVLYNNYPKVSKYDGKQWSTVELPGKTGYSVVYSGAVCDTSGNLWFASALGLVKYDRNTKLTKSYNTYNSSMAFENIHSMCLDKDNNLWLTGSQNDKSNIITKYSIKDGIWKNYSVLNKNDYYYSYITVDSSNQVYLGDLLSGVYKVTFNAIVPDFTINNIVCTGASDGNIKFHPANDNINLYSIDNGITYKPDSVFSDLSAGTYSLKVKNGLCVSETKTVNLTEPNGIFKVDKKDVSCTGDSNGSINITSLDLNDITFKWSTGAVAAGITNLVKGIYTVDVSHSGTCNFQRQFEIFEPKALSLRDSFYNYCGTTKGAIYLSVAGGTKPYKFNWSDSKTSVNNEGLEAGTYSVTVTDDNNCPSIAKSYKIEALPAIYSPSVISSSKSYLCDGSALISASKDFSSYQWFRNGGDLNLSTKNITVNDSGLYVLKVVDTNQCFAFDTINIVPKSKYDLPGICLVTVDESTNKNKIVWNKFKADSSVRIIIEKETSQSGIYNEIGDVPSYQSGTYIDEFSAPLAKADRYRIKVMDECSIKSEPTEIHKTIHLTANVGNNKEINLVWSGYEGFFFNSYNIYRGTSKSNLQLLTTIQNNLNSYSDLNPPQSGLFYLIEAVSPNNCNPDAFKSTINSARSNFADNGLTPVNSLEENYKVIVSPNPSGGNILIQFDRDISEKIQIKLVDLTGKTVFIQNDVQGNSVVLERNNIPKGLYTLIVNGNKVYRTKIIFQ